MDNFNGVCPQCGKALQIPVELQEFSCMYCGARLKPADIAPGYKKKETQADLHQLAKELAHCVVAHHDKQNKVTRHEFEATSDEYLEACKPVIMKLDGEVSYQDKAAIETLANLMIDEMNSFWSSKKASELYKEQDKIVMAVFFAPALGRLNLPICRPFAEALQAAWVKRYPKSPFYLGTYEDLCKGFRKKFAGLCFITTAICEFEGKSDDCEELTAFRSFRDHWLRAQPDGEQWIREYYDIAPGLVFCIDRCSDREKTYEYLRKNYLNECYAAIQQGNMAACKQKYIRMVQYLKNKFYLS